MTLLINLIVVKNNSLLNIRCFMILGHLEDAYADRGDVHVQISFHHHQYVPPHACLRTCWGNAVWICQVRR